MSLLFKVWKSEVFRLLGVAGFEKKENERYVYKDIKQGIEKTVTVVPVDCNEKIRITVDLDVSMANLPENIITKIDELLE